jgi:nucleotide-binding universal stress UspA family protein
MITIDDRSTDSVFGFHLSGTLTRDDYRKYLPRLEEAIRKHGKVSVLVHVESLSGIRFGALWEELKFDLKHFRHFKRIALVGDKKWHEWSISFASHLTPAEGRYFPSAELEEAWSWIRSGSEVEIAEPAAPSAGEPVRRILFATDFSENASTALKWALKIAKAHDASLSILHVAHDTATMTSPPRGVQEQIAHSLNALKDLASNAGLQVTSQWRSGKPWEIIVAEARDCDLVVIGARGHTPVPQVVLGSTADRVLRTAEVPVLTVHHADARDDQMPRNVLVPTDFSVTASLALEAVVRFCDAGATDGLEITLLHAWQPLVEYERMYATTPPPNPPVGTVEQAKEILETLADKVRDQGIDVTPVIRQGYPAKVIEEEAEAINADLIGMGTHGHSGLARLMLGSIAERVVQHVRCPVLSVGLEARARTGSTRTTEAVGAAT